MSSVRRRGLVGLIALALITAAQAGPASPASADSAPVVPTPRGTVTGRVYFDRVAPQNLVREGEVGLELSDIPFGDTVDIVDGVFRFEGYIATRYTLHVYFEQDGLLTDQYLGQVNEWRDARFFTVAADRTKNVDVVLRRYATIEGTVSLPAGMPAALAPVEVHRATGDGRLENLAYTDGSGRYSLPRLEPGFYVMRFAAPYTDPDAHVTEWSGDTTQRALAKRIVVSQWGQVITGVDAELAPTP
ncbi:hypothetical protein ABID70_002641 [Clavibacter michiganensis]|uniref:carboxypeptidase-like regulatory domain-containing protein n=1 Tax=Clavibacter michiganensis TaxID=28447 RepID=UPI001AEAA8AA|nr:carboxypeptidase-like regulatory domain-containing protein [Clavibacter michiganensis]MBP2457115.1 hypothetical protein [Clavibacter michiganensis]MDQ0409685.1 hypothetical protein [Clavibacter michiganensis]